MGRLAEMQRKLLEVLHAYPLAETILTLRIANDGARSHGRGQCQPGLVGRKGLPEFSVWNLPTCPVYQHRTSNSVRSLTHSQRSYVSQKMDLGACPKSHTERLKTEFVAAKEANPSDPIFNRFQMEYEANIFAFVDECDRRIRAAHRRLEKTPEENAKTTNLVRVTLASTVFLYEFFLSICCGQHGGSDR